MGCGKGNSIFMPYILDIRVGIIRMTVRDVCILMTLNDLYH
jgi:hypothetical protein